MSVKIKKSVIVGLSSVLLAMCLIATQTLWCKAYGSNESLDYNTGHRNTVATSLSSDAKSYYAGYNYDYSKIKNNSVGSEELKSSLSDYMQSTLEDQVNYSSLPRYWQYTDAQDGNPGVTFFYSGDVSTDTSDLNREHVWPKSLASFYKKNGGCDLHHLRPTHSSVNSSRSHYVMAEFDESNAKPVYYGDVLSGYIKDGQFEPVEDMKGDVARILLYVHLCWGQPNLFEDVSEAALPAPDSDDNKNDGTRVIESLDTLLQWNYNDPVDTWEMSQNDLIQSVQGNRNVFIDYPEYAWKVFGAEVPQGITSPSSNN